MASVVVPDPSQLPLPGSFQPLSASPLRLPPAWMQSSFDLELLLAAYGIRGEYIATTSDTNNSTLLRVVQQGVSGPPADKVAEQVADSSVQIHRAHNLARQVEVLHDALLHAFSEDKDLQPHDVVVLCADIQNAAPILEAVFDKTIEISRTKSVRLPLVIADRTLKDVSDGADLASNLLQLMMSRFDLESFMLVAASPLVMKNYGISASDIAVWSRHLDNTRLRWGLDADHRQQHGLAAPELNAHGWLEAIERLILGAVMNVGDDAPVVAGKVRPVPFVESSDTASLTALAGLLAIVARFEQAARIKRSVADWCVETELTLLELCGDSCAELDEVLQVLNAFQRASHSLTAGTSAVSYAVRFAEFAEYVAGELTASSGRLPLRSGSITATSFVPLRTVPFKVVCIVGFDDGTLPMGEPEGDDIIAATPMLGDGDPKIESRRVFLDALMSAEKKFIVTCTGRSIKNNKAVPLITPLNEFLDFCRLCGIDVPDDGDKLSAIEYSHPRHLGSPENFQATGGPVEGKIWSHDPAGLLAARERIRVSESSGSDDGENGVALALPAPLKEITLSQLENLVIDPLRHYLQFGLQVRTEWSTNDASNVLPLFAEGRDVERHLRDAFYAQSSETEFANTLRSADILPISPFDETEIDAAIDVLGKYRTKYNSMFSSSSEAIDIEISSEGSPVLKGSVDGYHVDQKALIHVSFSDKHLPDVPRMMTRALAVVASGRALEWVVMFHKSDTKDGLTVRKIRIDEQVTTEVARQKVFQLLAVEPIARSVACPLFDETASVLFNGNSDRDAAEAAFDNFVEDERKYSRSRELTIFGATPDFAQVYADDTGLVASFFALYFVFLKAADDKFGQSKGWRLMK